MNIRNETILRPVPHRVGLSLIAKFGAAILTGFAAFANHKTEAFESNCPFCTAASQTLRQEILSMDVVGIGKLVPDGRGEIDGNAEFQIDKVLVGKKYFENIDKIGASYFGSGKTTKQFLLMGVDPKSLVWSSPLPITPEAEKYIESILKLPDSPTERLKFYMQFFENPDPMLARDSYDEFALAPYSDVILIKDSMDREKLLTWVQDTSKSPDRKRLYYTMLGICGKPEDVELFEKLINSKNPEARAGLDALLAAYLTLKGESGLELVEELFFKSKDTQYADIYSAVMALRFHGTEVNQLPKESIMETMHVLLDRPDLADLVIPDLARWGDWSQVDKMTKLFIDAKDDYSWVRVPVVNYLRACPLPEAKDKLVELEKVDPAAVKRAKTFFPIPTPAAPKKSDSSFIPLKMPIERALVLENHRKDIRIASLDSSAFLPNLARKQLAGLNGEITLATTAQVSETLNLLAPLAVMVIATVMMAIIMWTIATSGGASLIPVTVSRTK